MGDGLALLVIGMGVVFSVLIVLALATWALERVFRPESEKAGSVSTGDPGGAAAGGDQAAAADEADTLERVALAAVGLHLLSREGELSYAPLVSGGRQWKLAGRIKSLRR